MKIYYLFNVQLVWKRRKIGFIFNELKEIYAELLVYYLIINVEQQVAKLRLIVRIKQIKENHLCR